jgi:hypothetical protein
MTFSSQETLQLVHGSELIGCDKITFQIPGNTFYSGARLGSIEWEDLWLMFHQKWLDLNLLVVWCL